MNPRRGNIPCGQHGKELLNNHGRPHAVELIPGMLVLDRIFDVNLGWSAGV
jgi:hypothetical protein